MQQAEHPMSFYEIEYICSCIANITQLDRIV